MPDSLVYPTFLLLKICHILFSLVLIVNLSIQLIEFYSESVVFFKLIGVFVDLAADLALGRCWFRKLFLRHCLENNLAFPLTSKLKFKCSAQIKTSTAIGSL